MALTSLALACLLAALALWPFVTYLWMRIAGSTLHKIPGPPVKSFWTGMRSYASSEL